LRRKTTSDQGVLKYYQSGGTVTIGNNSAPTLSRGVFEVMNTGSVFNYTGGNLIIARAQSATDPAIYINPTSYSLVGGAILTIGNANTTAGQNIGIYSSIPLKDIVVSSLGGAKTAKIYTLALTIDSLLIEAGQSFDANSLNLTLNGNFHNSSSITAYNAGSNTTSFTKTNQKIIGSSTFNNLTINTTSSADSVRLYDNINVNGNLTITRGRLHDKAKTITLIGNFTNTGFHYSQSTTIGGVLFQGTLRQEISGTGTYGLLEIDNSNGVELQNNFILVDRDIKLTNGSFFIKQHELQLGLNANVTIPSGTFSKDRMVVTNGALSDKGIKKAVNSGTPADILIPIGVVGVYSPVKFTSLNTLGSGYIYIRPVNAPHPTALDKNNVLQYYWNLQTLNFITFQANADFYYDQTDVSVTGINLESDYIPAYLYDINWSKFGAESVDANLNIVKFNFNTGELLNGDFTAGISDAIPDQVPVFVSITDGDWEDITTWEREDAVPVTFFPNGQVVKIKHDVTIANDLKSSYKTIIDTTGKLIVGSTIGHYFGRVSGRGHLAMETGRLPAGNYDDFFDCNGGTIEWGGDVNYEIPAKGTSFRRMIFSGTGTKSLPSNDITICDTLWINGSTVNNTTHNNQITVNGLFYLQSGIFSSGSGATATVVFNGTTPQNLVGDFTGSSVLNNVTMNNSAGLTLGGNVTMAGILTLTNGNIITNGNNLLLEVASTVSPDGGSSSSYIDGNIFKILPNGSDFKFPIGDGTRYGKIEALNTVSGSEITWEAQYYNLNPEPPYTITSVLAPVISVSDNEFWRFDGTFAGQAQAILRWDDLSAIPAQTTDRSKLRIVRWSSSSRWEQVLGTVADGGVNSGIITSTSALASGEHILTIGSTETTPVGTARITSSDSSFCSTGSTNIRIALTGSANWTIEVYRNGALFSTIPGIAASPYLLNVNQAGLYTINRVWDTNGTILGNVFGVGVIITSVTEPTPTIVPAQPIQTFCEGETTNYSVTNVPGHTYNWVVNGGTILAGQGTNSVSVEWTITGDITVTEGSTLAGCDATDAINPVTVIAAPTANDQTPANLCSEISGANAQVTGIDLTALEAAINGGVGITYTWYEDAALTIPVVTPANVIINITITGGVYSANKLFYCLVDNATCTNVATVTYTIFRTPLTGPQYHLPNL